MESNPEYNQSKGDSNNSWYILSFLSWTLLLTLEVYSYENGVYFWGRYNILNYFPIKISFPFIQTFLLILILMQYITFLIQAIFKKNQNIHNSLFGQYSKYHFIPLLFISAIIIAVNELNGSFNNYNKRILIFDMIFTILGLISLVFIYINIQLNDEWYIVMAIKKGFFSSFIILLWYNFWNLIVYLKTIDDYNSGSDDSLQDFLKGTGISFPFIIGIGGFIFAFIFRDIIAAFTLFLIYLGCVIGFFGKNAPDKEIKELINKNADGIIDIILMIISLAFIIFLAMRFKNELFQ